MRAVCSDTVDTPGNNKREYLFARPQGFGFEDGRLRNVPVPCGEVHEQVHEVTLEIKEQFIWNKDPK